MATIAHSVLDGEFKFGVPIDSSTSSSGSVLSQRSTSPLEDCLSRTFPFGLSDINMEPLLPLFASNQLGASGLLAFGGSGRSKMEELGLLSLDQTSLSSSVRGSKSHQKTSEFYSPFSQNASYLSNGAGTSAFSKIDHFKPEYEYQDKVSPRLPIDFVDSTTVPDPLAGQERFLTVTERIPVPSSDHVAEIVGKNGQRIKQLREQLKVWVKTPSREEQPVFEVTGLPEKLAEAKQLILQMSDHFSKVQQERLARSEPNRVEDRLYVEQDKVGLIVGASGQTIRWVQQLSDTHIATPRKQESIPGLPPPQTFFTICGTKEKVKFAKQLICEYVTLRCQGLWLDAELEQSAEASRLVREFHQRRQAVDTQRRATPTQATTQSGLLAPGLGRPLISSGGVISVQDQDETVRPSMITDMKSLWPEADVKQESGSNVWNHAMFGLPTSDRRYSADSPSPLGALIGGFGLDSSQLKKSMSDDQVAQQPTSGWM